MKRSEADTSPPLHGAGWAVRKYANIFRVSLIERLTYRGDFFFSTCLRFLPMVTTILLWTAVYQGASGGDSSGGTRLSGFSYREMIAYLLLVHVSRMFSSMPGLASGIARDIRDGSLKKYLLQPIDMLSYLVSCRAAARHGSHVRRARAHGVCAPPRRRGRSPGRAAGPGRSCQ